MTELIVFGDKLQFVIAIQSPFVNFTDNRRILQKELHNKQTIVWVTC
jgi:hypothetical protein